VGSWAACRQGLVNFIDTRDVADVARVALLENSIRSRSAPII